MSILNDRIVRVGVQIAGNLQFFEGLDIRCYGELWASEEMSHCQIKISNLTRDQKNWLLKNASPMQISKNPNRSPINVTLDVGRKNSFQPFRLFEGYCWARRATAPPDIGVVLDSLTNTLESSLLQRVNYGGLIDLKSLATNIAKYYGYILNFKASPNFVSNFNYTGGAQMAIDLLRLTGDIRVHLDNKVLNVYDNTSYAGDGDFLITTQTGMVGIPEAVEYGVAVSSLVRPEIKIGHKITVNSGINPAVNGSYWVSNISYEITSRDDPFWYHIYGSNLQNQQGTT